MSEPSSELNNKNNTTKDKIDEYEFHIHSLSEKIEYLEKELTRLKQSRFWKLRQVCLKITDILFGGKNHKQKSRHFFRHLLSLFSSFGKKKARTFLKKTFKHLYLITEDIPVQIISPEDIAHARSSSSLLSSKKRTVGKRYSIHRKKEDLMLFKHQPLISIIMPVYNVDPSFLTEAIDSVISQVYTNWELCIADDNSTQNKLREIIEKYSKTDSRIRFIFRKENGHISACLNSALSLAKGEYVAFLDHDDLLTPDALFEIVRTINIHPEADFIYSDEDKLDENGHLVSPFHKPDWSPETLLSRNYITHFATIRKRLVDQVNGFREGYEGSQDYDLFLRISELTSHIYHIPQILYHWRIHKESTAAASYTTKSYAYKASQKALEDALIRRSEKGSVFMNPGMQGHYTIRYELTHKPKVSIIIPTKDQTDILRNCLESIYQKSTYPLFEVIVLDNNSRDPKLFKLLKEYAEKFSSSFQWHTIAIPFNFSKLMNMGVQNASGDHLIFLNNDTEVITPDWIEAMLEQAQRPSIGAVGAKLLFPNNTIQHAGVVVGMHELAGHIFLGEYKDSTGYFGQIRSVTNYSAVTGACLMCRKNIFLEVGGFDESLEIEFNDIDLCLKILEKGYYNVYIPHATLYHYESLTRGNPYSTKERLERHLKECDIFRKRWSRYIEHDPYYNVNLSRSKENCEIDY